MKQTEITKTKGGWLKHLLLLCVTLLGVVGFATAAPNYPFPNNYAYPYGGIYTGSDVQTKIQALYTTWLSKYYEESGTEARIKFVQAGESGVNSVSEGIAYGMLIMVYMDNATNNTQSKFDKLWNYYKNNTNKSTNHGVMNWKVKGFTHQVADPVSGNSNGATDADIDAAQALLMAYKQWGNSSYLDDAQTLIQNLWTYEVNSNKQLKPGDMFDDYKNPCYFITNAMKLFDQVKGLQGWTNSWDWTTVANNCYTLMSKVANASTGLIPDWCYENGTLLTGIKDSKFESIFGYDAVRIPWRMAHAYAWYGDTQAKSIASKITTWAKGKYPSPNDIVDGYFLDGRPGDGTGAFSGSLSSWGTSKNACFKGGLSIGSMVDPSFASYMSDCWQYGSATDVYGAYYTHTTQLLFMLCLTGNMPNFWDMLPVYLSSKTDAAGSAVVIDMSKPISASSASSSIAKFTVTTYPTAADTAAKTNGTTISVSSASVSGKVVTLNLSSEIADPYIFVTYNGTTFTVVNVENEPSTLSLLKLGTDDKTIASPLFSSHIRDIALLHQAGLKVVIIPGARTRIDEVLSAAKIEWSFKDNIRVTTEDAMPLVKMAAFDVSNSVMTSLAANNITAVIGNWVRSRSKGIIDGFDYGIAGEIDRLDIESLQTVLNDGFIPIFPCIGWNAVGHPYNITSTNLAQQVAINLNADKLFFVMEDGGVKKENNCRYANNATCAY